MSVFNTIKGALNTVPQGLSSRIRSLSKSLSSSGEVPVDPVIKGVDLDAGADLLNKYQDDWAEMHQNAEQNAVKAQEIDEKVTQFHQEVERQNDQMNLMMSVVSSLPQLADDLAAITAKLGSLEQQFAELESDMVELDNVCEEVELHKNKLHHQYQLHSYRQRRHVELETTKVHLAKKHASNAAGYERQLQEKIRERQQVFEEAFTAELQYYKQHGNTNMKPVLTGPSPDLAEVSIEADQRALDDFLGSVEMTSGTGMERSELEDPEDDIPSNINGTVRIMQDEDLEEVPKTAVANDNNNAINVKSEERVTESVEEQEEKDCSREKDSIDTNKMPADVHVSSEGDLQKEANGDVINLTKLPEKGEEKGKDSSEGIHNADNT